jgi:uncharacterized protein YndB with AHSA1/START domain/uncharacterized protein YciI
MTLPPIRRSVVVRATPQQAFRAWTQEIGQWWPLPRFSVFGEGGRVAFEGEQLVETAADGTRAVWGRVLEAEPPHRLRFSWHPGSDEVRGTVEVRFVPITDDLTLVVLEHTGWEAYADPLAARGEYRGGWAVVQGCYEEWGSASDRPVDHEVWLVLEHTAGTAAGPEGVFGHPLFAEHRRFLGELADAGVLVAAGSLPDTPGAGQTVIRVRAAEAAGYVAAAQRDGAVAGDLLAVRVRPWAVALAP